MAARTSSSNGTSKKDELVIYRLSEVEKAVKAVDEKVSKLDVINRQDLTDFRDTILLRVNDMKLNFEKDLELKADQKQVDDLRTLVKAVGSIIGSVMAGLALFYLTRSN